MAPSFGSSRLRDHAGVRHVEQKREHMWWREVSDEAHQWWSLCAEIPHAAISLIVMVLRRAYLGMYDCDLTRAFPNQMATKRHSIRQCGRPYCMVSRIAFGKDFAVFAVSGCSAKHRFVAFLQLNATMAFSRTSCPTVQCSGLASLNTNKSGRPRLVGSTFSQYTTTRFTKTKQSRNQHVCWCFLCVFLFYVLMCSAQPTETNISEHVAPSRCISPFPAPNSAERQSLEVCRTKCVCDRSFRTPACKRRQRHAMCLHLMEASLVRDGRVDQPTYIRCPFSFRTVLEATYSYRERRQN